MTLQVSPVWSPDSRRPAYIAGPADAYNTYEGVERIIIADVDGSAPVILPATGQLLPGWYGHVKWSPDGRRLAVLSWPPVPGNPGPLKSSGSAQIVSLAADDPADQAVIVARLRPFGVCGLDWGRAE